MEEPGRNEVKFTPPPKKILIARSAYYIRDCAGPLSVRPVSVRPSEILVIFAKGTSVCDRVISASTIFQKSVHGLF